MKITEKVSFNIASEASYVYILSGQKFIKSAKNGRFGEILKTWSLRSNSVTRVQTGLIKNQLHILPQEIFYNLQNKTKELKIVLL